MPSRWPPSLLRMALFAAAGLLASCKSCKSRGAEEPSATASPAGAAGDAGNIDDAGDAWDPMSLVAKPSSHVLDAGARDGGERDAAGSSSTPDAGVSACRVLYGPVQQPFTGPAALVATESGVEVVFHKNGVPQVNAVPATPITPPSKTAAPPARKRLDGDPERASRPACAVAGSHVFCSDARGEVHRTVRSRPGDPAGRESVVAHADMGAVVTAAMLGEQPVLGYLAVRTTSEGRTSEAFAQLGDQPPVRISESGSGATDVVFASRGDGSVLALSIDARRAMSPVHARVLTLQQGKLVQGPDVVVYVGGGSEHQVHGALGMDAKGDTFGLMPTSAEAGFGLAIIRIDAPPRLDEPAQVSLYPNGFDFAAVAATRGESAIVVARVRPLGADPSSIRMVELGKIDPKEGSFSSFGFVPSSSSVQNVAIVRDRFGAIWVEYTDGGGSWLERRACP
ncbi:hypothetical protein [Pendulispora albinea]|uniref:hypothetical protein n=1 Tax=Pendulispora albinea TaxID=2741071 RepID=UPI00374E15A2